MECQELFAGYGPEFLLLVGFAYLIALALAVPTAVGLGIRIAERVLDRFHML